MADYDVGVVSLATPAPSAPLAQCRPVVSVRNNGIHDAVASGYVRIYSAGLLVYESEAYSDTIGPGETRPASAVDYWTPEAEGPYMVQGYFTTPLDQVEPNNNLWPTLIVISGAEPPPPTPVPLHASQHESGGADEMSLEDLPGRTADGQMPINHASFHENNGIDRIDVTDLPGVLGAAQNPKAHAASHKTGGSDLLSVLGLPDVTDLELVARKGASNGYAALDTDAAVPIAQLSLGTIEPEADEDPDAHGLRLDRFLGPTNPVPHASTHKTGGRDELGISLNETGAFVNVPFDAAETTIATITIPTTWMNSTLGVVLNLGARLTTAVGAGAVLRLKVKQGAATLVQHDVDVNKNSVAPVSIHAYVAAIDTVNLKAFLEFMADSDAVQHLGTHVATTPAGTAYSAAETVFSITAQFVNGAVTDILTVDMSHSWNTGQPS